MHQKNTRMQALKEALLQLENLILKYFLHVTSGAKLIDASRRGERTLFYRTLIIRGRSLRLVKYRDTSTKVATHYVVGGINGSVNGISLLSTTFQ